MGFAKALVFVQLTILLLNTFTVLAQLSAIEAQAPVPSRHHGYYAHPIASPAHPPTHGHHHHHPKPHPHPPTASPVHPPAHAPAHPPTHHHHAHPPSHMPAHSPYHHAPVQPPSHPPTHHAPPAHSPAPVHPPTYPPKKPFPRSFVAVQGVVYCKSCKYSGVDTLLNATAIAGKVLNPCVLFDKCSTNITLQTQNDVLFIL
ncbi:non-classical arabinogalactan protein 31-like [Rosa sericea]